MPRSMADPNYRYTPWTPERRKAASEAGKARWAAKRAAEMRRWEAQQEAVQPLNNLFARVRERIAEEQRLMEQARIQYFASKKAIEEMEEAQEHLLKARVALAVHIPKEDLA